MTDDDGWWSGDPADLIDAADEILSIAARPEWYQRAACRGRTDVMYAEHVSFEAVTLCAGCPVIRQCEAVAVAEYHGYWAGQSARHRARLRRSARREAA